MTQGFSAMLRTATCHHQIIRSHRAAIVRRARYHSSSLPEDCVIFSGIQPTGVPHLGNYLGALRQWARLQRETPLTAKLIFSIVDLHAITTPQTRDDLKRWKHETFCALLAVGLDPLRCTLFFQSDVSAQQSSCCWS